MLKSIIKNKSRKFFDDEGVSRSPREDIITSTVLGYLDYLTGESAATALRWMFDGVLKIPDGYIKSAVELWPKRASCEPDAIIDLASEGSPPIRIIIEAKWGSNKLTSEQLEKQWCIFGQEEMDKGTAVYHIGLVEHKGIQDRDAIENAPPNIRRQRRLLTWREVTDNLVHREEVQGSREANALAEDIIAALQFKAGQRPFTGWSDHGVDVTQPARIVFFQEIPWWSVHPVSVSGPHPFFRSDI